jgi:MFS family permease
LQNCFLTICALNLNLRRNDTKMDAKPTRLNFGQMLVLNAYWVGLSFKWNVLHPIVLPAVLLYLVPEAEKNTWLGILTFVGLILAMIIQPISGALSDRWRSRWGRRRPLALLGTLAEFAFLGLLAWSGGLTWVIIGYLGLQIFSNIAHGPMQGLLPDRVPAEQMGTASSFKNLMDMGGMVVALLAAGNLLSPGEKHPVLIMVVVVGVVAVSAAVTIMGVRENRSDTQGFEAAIRNPLVDLLRVDFKRNRSFWGVVAVRFMFLFGIYAIQAFAQYYIRDVLGAANPVKATGDLMAGLSLALIACVLIGGWLTDRMGAKRVIQLAGLITAAGCVLLMLARTPLMLILMGSVVGSGIGLFLTANWALLNRLVPPEEAGKYIGLTNLATAGSGAVARLEGPAIDFLNSAYPGLWVGYTAMFLLGALICLLSVLLLGRVDAADRKQ